MSSDFRHFSKPKLNVIQAVEELNERFREHGVGYQFEELKIVRVDSQVLHAEVVKPALHLLSESAFSGANADFLKAHEHYRHVCALLSRRESRPRGTRCPVTALAHSRGKSRQQWRPICYT